MNLLQIMRVVVCAALFALCVASAGLFTIQPVAGQEAGQPPEDAEAILKKSDRQLEAKPAHPALRWGRGLKQRRSGLFWKARQVRRITEEACPSLPDVRMGSPQSNPRQHHRVSSPDVGVSTAPRRGTVTRGSHLSDA